MDSYILFLIFFLVSGVVGLVIYGIVHRSRELTGPAQVISHRLELGIGGGQYGDNWNRLVTFRLSDGTDLELYTTKEDYAALTDGQKGTLTWDKDLLIHFDPDQN